MSDDQLTLVAPPTPEEIMAGAEVEHGPFCVRICLTSGGKDSTVLAHRMRDHYDGLVFIDTGTALPGVREHVTRIAAIVGKPLIVYSAGEKWREMVLGTADVEASGFPGPRGHRVAYNRLKLRQVEAMVRDAKRKRTDRVALLTGVRIQESSRRRWNVANLGARKGAQVWINPIRHMTTAEVYAYMREHDLPESDVTAILHRSGECCCGAFAEPGEREMLQSLWPEWFETTIGALEREAETAGLARCRWGDGFGRGEKTRRGSLASPGPLCDDCQLRLDGVA
jgi:3'-phosphoadenosine 5'-phosphosulfate sulfotransferase (PAPS reductase)/FAD synthetase